MNNSKKIRVIMAAFPLMLVAFMMSFNSCGSNNSSKEEATQSENEAFYATQPLQSGLYDADYYDITGVNPRKGHFDGRIYFSLSPETSAFYVFENGNRTKIDHIVALKQPFEKNDSVYFSLDTKDQPVTLNTDSTAYLLNFRRGGEDYIITFNPKPRHTGTAVEILEKMNAQRNKAK